MIVRVLTEGQYRLDSAYLDKLNEMDNRLVGFVATGNEQGFTRLFGEMLDLVRQKGQPLPVEEIVESDVILPAPDITLEEAKRLFTGEGLIPD